MKRSLLAPWLLLTVTAAAAVFGQSAAKGYLPREGRADPALKARMTALLAARGIRAAEVRIVEPEWQVVRAGLNGAVRGRTINAAVVTKDARGGRAVRFVLFRCDTARGRGLNFAPPAIAEIGPARPL